MARPQWTDEQKKAHGEKVRAALAAKKKNGAKKSPKAKPYKTAVTALETIDLWLLKEKLEIDLTEVKDELRNRL